MSTKNGASQDEGPSLISVMLTAVAITVNHLYTLGAPGLLLGATLLVVPAALWTWFRRTGSRAALVGYMLMNLWIVVGFGIVKGLWGTILPLYLGTLLASHSASYPSPTLGPYAYEASVESCDQDMWLEPPMTPLLTKNVACTACGCNAC